MLEAIVAMGIIVTAVSSALSLVIMAVKAEKDSETTIVAVNLAREGIEAVRAMRDSNWLAGKAYDSGLKTIPPLSDDDCTAIPFFDVNSTGQANGYWSLDFGPDALLPVYRYTSGPNIGLMFQYNGAPPSSPAPWSQSGFNRLVTVNFSCRVKSAEPSGRSLVAVPKCPCPSDEEFVGLWVKSEVRWSSSGRPKQITLEEKLFDWR
ncbi:hypothetical protein A3C96_00610 [Candidatus Uhrbacteria bacterium RIFCSPHIGHO2_02_FULL_60_10]|uniref:Uncharacterized protein n=1 Tax=Candidatus Uhrbacteria bacterium RIFCSPHIGHO2_02_FULL_60_10 TaxID=1802392 RepID=A0A1F7UA14_9BACT|nr:MAG: hypothetical protein A3C96_00610 [Candidatus Uhrbacteria bacterium RIFCSPHIGHO2_02_FULL_60_10]